MNCDRGKNSKEYKVHLNGFEPMNKKLNSIIRGNFYHRKLPLFLYSKKERMEKMNEKKFLQQVYSKLENQLEQEVKLADDSIEILDGDKVIFRVDSKGDMLYSAEKQFSNIVNKIYRQIESIVELINGYKVSGGERK